MARLVVTPPIDAAGRTYDIGYTVTDSAGASASAKVTVTVTEPNVPAPTAVADQARTTQGVGVSIPVLGNDIDPLGRGLTIVGANVSDGSGTATVSGDQIVYTPERRLLRRHHVHVHHRGRPPHAGRAGRRHRGASP